MTDLAWLDDALCTQVGGDMWFPDKGGTARDAKRVCRACPVTTPCLNYALTTGTTDGVYGGYTYYERCRLRRGKP